MSKEATTLSIDKGIKKQFKAECASNGVDMSGTTEMLWKDYIELSQQIKKERNEQEQDQ